MVIMDINVLEKEDKKLKIEIRGETHTFLNLLREKAWDAGADQASYMQEHPYLIQPKIIIRAKDPKKVLTSAAQKIIDDAEELRGEFSRALKR